MTTASPGALLLVAGAGLVAGAVNAVAGGGTLLSFPALLLAGLSPLTANVTNTIGLLPGYVGGSTAYRVELGGQGRRFRALAMAGAMGAVAGAVILLRTPPRAFAAAVPWLLLGSCALLAVQPAAVRLAGSREPAAAHRSPALLAAAALAGVYGGYFGAGLGVVLIAVLGMFIDEDLHRLNALKGAISLLINALAALVFVAFGPVRWIAAAVMLPASLAGGFAGVLLARRLDARVLRVVILCLGVAVAIRLLV